MKHFFWNPTEPPTILFNLVEDLAYLAGAANIPKTGEQIVNYGLDILRKTGEYENCLLEWFALPLQQQTWTNFKPHLVNAQLKLKQVRGSSMQNTPFHQANAVLCKDLASMRDDVVASLNEIASTAEAEEEPTIPPSIPPQSSVNAVTDASQQAFIAELRALRTEFANAFRAVPFNPDAFQPDYNNHGRSYGGGRGNGSGRRGNGGRGQFRYRRNLGNYYWTHGACTHSGTECRNPAAGHKASATFANRMNGCSKYCRQANEQMNNGNNN